MTKPKPITRGWGFPATSRLAHFYTGARRSLCDRHAAPELLIADTGDHNPDDCKACTKAALNAGWIKREDTST